VRYCWSAPAAHRPPLVAPPRRRSPPHRPAAPQLVREFRAFGDAEAADLARQLEAQRAQLLDLRAMRAERLRQEEALALAELRRAVGAVREVDAAAAAGAAAAVAAAEELGRGAEAAMEAEMRARAAELLGSVDIGRLLDVTADEAGAAKPLPPDKS
jgi:hypothetical protein